MNRLAFVCSCFLIMIFSCKKNVQAPFYAGYYGHWQFIASGFGGPVNAAPSPDSVVVLSLIQNNTYQISLNGQTTNQGTFSIDSDANRTTLTFNNITQPAGSDTVVVAGNLSYFLYNFARIGQLTLFQHNNLILQGDTLVLIQESTGFEYTSDYFKKIS